MKTIKFRIYNKEEKRMIDSGATPMMLKSFFEHTAVLNTRDKAEYQQFTGLLDKDGVEIYDGDIVKAIAEEEYFECSKISQIARSSTNTSWCVLKPGYTLGMHLLWGGWKSLEIIGNIYDNPELQS